MMNFSIRIIPVFIFLVLASIPAYCQYHPEIDNIRELAFTEQKSISRFVPNAPSFIGSDFDLVYHRFNWFIDPSVKYIKGSVTSYFRTVKSHVNTINFELFHEMTIDSIQFHGINLEYDLTDSDQLQIFLDHELPVNQLDSITVYYQGIPGPGTGYEGFIQDHHNGTPIIYTFSEPYFAKEWWPCKNDLSDKIDSIDIFITTPMQFCAASNGILFSETLNGDYRICHWKHRYQIATYLIAIAVTNYSVYSDYVNVDSDSVEIMNFVFPEDLERIKKITPGVIPVMDLFNELFIPYPFGAEKYGHAQQTTSGAMENQTITFSGTFNHELLAHELAHSWFGDYITCRSWHEIWLNEGFATYLAGLTYEHMFEGYWWPIWKRNNIDYVTSQPGGSVYCEDTTSISRIFSSRLSYSKGAMILHMIRWIIGDYNFYSTLRNYLNDPDLAYGYASTIDLKQHLESASGKDLTGFFSDWYYGEGFPIYFIKCTYKENDQIEVVINQSQSHPSVDFFELPVPILFKGENADTLIVFDHQYSGQSFTIRPDFHIDSVFFDPDKWIISKGSTVSLSIQGFGDPSKPFIYPNPVTDVLWFRAGFESVSEIKIFNIDGSLHTKFEMTLQPHQSHQLNLSGLTPGFYILTAIQDSGSFAQKVIKI
jgi:aminopeptidase N